MVGCSLDGRKDLVLIVVAVAVKEELDAPHAIFCKRVYILARAQCESGRRANHSSGSIYGRINLVDCRYRESIPCQRRRK